MGTVLVAPVAASAATIAVNTTADDFGSDMSHCSLREAIKSVDGTSGGDPTGTDFGGCVASGSYASGAGTPDTITLPTGIYQLSLSGSAEDNDVSGDLDVFRSMNIVGTGNPTIQQTVAGNRVLDVTATGKDLSLSGLTITGGDQSGAGTGGGIHYVGVGTSSLSLDGVTVSGNDTAGGNGGGIFTDSPTTITNSVISGNHAANTSGTGNGGGIYQDGATDNLSGVTLTIDHTSITGNFAGDASNLGSGGGIYRITKTADSTSNGTIQDSDISGNTAHFFGGGLYTQSAATLSVDRSLISGNNALVLRGGGMDAESQGTSVGHLNLLDTTITQNTASAGGGGIKSGNVAPLNIALLFSTLADNTSNISGTGSELEFSGNSSPKPILTIEGTIFAASNPSAMSACRLDGTDFLTTTDGGYNLSTDPTDTRPTTGSTPGCGLANPLPAGDRTGESGSVVNPLADNGGPTKTMQPTASSFATDNMPNGVCTAIVPAVTKDQRGFPRPDATGGNCDSGAYEAFTCNGAVVNTPGPFSPCVPSTPGGGSGGGGAVPSTPTTPTAPKKKCKKKKHRAAASKKCKKKKA